MGLGSAKRATGRPDERAAGARVGALFEQHGRMVYALCRMLLRDRQEAEDATQQTFLLALRSMRTGVEPDSPSAWLATIARHECGRRTSRRPPAGIPLTGAEEGTELGPPGLADQRAEIEALCSALAELPRTQREALVLREFYGLSYREVAAALGLSQPAVESSLFKSRRRLQEKLRPIRSAAGVFAMPATLGDALASAVPGFSAGAAAVGGAVVKVAWLPAASKLAAMMLALGAGTAITAADTHRPDLVTAGLPGSAPAHRSAVRLAPLRPLAGSLARARPAAARAARPVEQALVARPDSRRAGPETQIGPPVRSEPSDEPEGAADAPEPSSPPGEDADAPAGPDTTGADAGGEEGGAPPQEPAPGAEPDDAPAPGPGTEEDEDGDEDDTVVGIDLEEDSTAASDGDDDGSDSGDSSSEENSDSGGSDSDEGSDSTDAPDESDD